MLAPASTAFRPHPLLRGGHSQTLAGFYLTGRPLAYKAQQHRVALADGDQLVLHDDQPADWQPGDRAALLIHGLAGCHRSSYMPRVVAALEERGIRAFRLDLRGCGAGVGLARMPYHGGRSEDAAAALETITRLCPDSPVALVGFSMGGNIALKLLGEMGDGRCGHLDCAVAVCPPLDLHSAVRHIHRPINRLYERHFVRLLIAQVRERERRFPGCPSVPVEWRPRSLWEFDDVFTGPICGFGGAENYYRLASAVRVAHRIRLPALVIASVDDPLVPTAPLERLRHLSTVHLELTRHGGHMGFVGWRDGRSRWFDQRIVEWISSRTRAYRSPAAAECHDIRGGR